MARKRYTPEQVLGKLREAEVRLAQGERTEPICKALGITTQTYYRLLRLPRRVEISPAALSSR